MRRKFIKNKTKMKISCEATVIKNDVQSPSDQFKNEKKISILQVYLYHRFDQKIKKKFSESLDVLSP